MAAAEVRNLAQRSATAAKEIKRLINESIQRVVDGSELVNQSGKTLGEIVNSVKRVTDIIAEISAASQEQASGIDQVNKAIMQMNDTTQQNAALIEETTSASQSMKEQGKELMRQVGVFRVNGTGQNLTAGMVRSASRSMFRPSHGKPTLKKLDAWIRAGVGPGNGKNRRAHADHFDEFQAVQVLDQPVSVRRRSRDECLLAPFLYRMSLTVNRCCLCSSPSCLE